MYQKDKKKPANCFQLRVEKTLVEVFVLKHGAEGRSRTGTGCPTRPSSVRVYQFHHFGTHFYMYFIILLLFLHSSLLLLAPYSYLLWLLEQLLLLQVG